MSRRAQLRRVSAIAVALGLVAAACGGDDGDDAATTTTAAATTTTAAGATTTAAASTTTAAEGCDDSDPFLAGGSFSLSGPAGEIGKLAQEGAMMAMEDINAAGGILGRCLEILLRDDESDPTKGSLAVRELVDQEEVEFLVGPFLSSIIAAALEVTAPAEIPHVVAGVLPDAGDATKFPYVFRTEVVATLQGTTFVDYIGKNGWTKIGIIAVNNALGTSSADAVKAQLKPGMEIVASEFHESGTVDLTPQVRKLQDAGAEVLLLLNTAAPDQIAAIEARNGLAWEVPVIGVSSLGNAATRDALGAENMKMVYGGQAYKQLARSGSSNVPSSEKAAAFLERYKEYRGETELKINIQQAAGIYDSFMMMAAAINAVGEVDPAGIKEYLESNGYDGIKATYEYTAERHDGVGLDDLVFIEASSLKDGTLALAPNQ
jgi:branched-chain amino acid transport system substrate-binding protein